MVTLGRLFLTLTFLCAATYAEASSSYSSRTSTESLRILKRMEYKEGIPNGLLHAISLVETNIGQTEKYKPWPYTIRINRHTGKTINDIDDAFTFLDYLIDLGFKNFDLVVDDNTFYSLSAINLEDVLTQNPDAKSITISARSTIKYLKNKKDAENAINNLVDNEWYDFKIGIMQLNYQMVKNSTQDISDALNAYDNINIMVKQLKKIRTQHTWWESVGQYHSKKPAKAKRYVKNVWSMYQRVHKIKVR
ncbi:MAG TPA: hypothetical protein DCL21_07050 [Alphaproteobacteria bacterium]|nr:hypothetical protein [Alphaproteobacteria bacterium]